MSKNSGHEKAPVLAGAEALDNVNRSRKNVEMNNSTAITPDNLPVISHAGGRVVTTALLAKLYGTDDNNLIQNYQRNSGRFVAGKHFHKLEGAELKAFKNYMTESQVVQVAKNTRQIILWTERGAARHAKMLDTDEAWEVFEKLEDSYFQIKGQGGSSLPVPVQTLIGTVIGSDGEHVLDQVIDQKAGTLPVALRRSFKHTMKSRLRTRFSVQKTALIPAEELANACNFIAAYVFEGEYLGPEKAKPPLAIHYPIEALTKRRPAMLEYRGDGQAWLDVSMSDICSRPQDLSLCEEILCELRDAGYEIDGAWFEVRSLRNRLHQLNSFLTGLGNAMQQPTRYGVSVTVGRTAA